MICARCGSEYPGSLTECPVCGEPRRTPESPAPLGKAVLPILPHAESACAAVLPLILGILSCCLAYIGIVIGILAVLYGAKARKLYPQSALESSLGRAGFVLGIVGLIIQTLWIVYLAVFVPIAVEFAIEDVKSGIDSAIYYTW